MENSVYKLEYSGGEKCLCTKSKLREESKFLYFFVVPAGFFADRSSDAPHYGLECTCKAIVIRFLIMFGFKLKVRVKRLYYRALLSHSGFSKLLLSPILTCDLKMLTKICKKN